MQHFKLKHFKIKAILGPIGSTGLHYCGWHRHAVCFALQENTKSNYSVLKLVECVLEMVYWLALSKCINSLKGE